MGYYTEYRLDHDINDIGEFAEFFEAQTGYNFDYNNTLSGKWYDHEEHMKHISEQYPDKLFTLNGEGEESGDMWKKYLKNGKIQRATATITYADFDEDKLK